MSTISKALEQGFLNYYKTITGIGYVDLDKVHKLIIASWINDILEGKGGFLVDDEEYDILNELYMCVEGNCLVPYQNYCKEFVVNKQDMNHYVRITEVNPLMRFLEDNTTLRTN